MFVTNRILPEPIIWYNVNVIIAQEFNRICVLFIELLKKKLKLFGRVTKSFSNYWKSLLQKHNLQHKTFLFNHLQTINHDKRFKRPANIFVKYLHDNRYIVFLSKLEKKDSYSNTYKVIINTWKLNNFFCCCQIFDGFFVVAKLLYKSVLLLYVSFITLDDHFHLNHIFKWT